MPTGPAVTPYLRLRIAAAQARDKRQPGYLAAAEAAAHNRDETTLHIAAPAWRDLETRFPPPAKPQPRRQRFALGDAVERVLTTVGITKELVRKITRKPCRCPARQRWLNEWGYRQQERVERVVHKAAKWYGIS